MAAHIRARTLAANDGPSPRGDTLRERRQFTARQDVSPSSVAFSASQSIRSRSAIGTSRWTAGGASIWRTEVIETTARWVVNSVSWPSAVVPAPS